jgi:hypothetical protein
MIRIEEISVRLGMVFSRAKAVAQRLRGRVGQTSG